MKHKQVLSVLVENQAGVLNKITGLFARRAFNIDSLAVGVTEDESASRITMIVDSGSHAAEQVEKQLHKLISVIKVKRLEDGDYIGRELILIKLSANAKNRSDIKNICDIMNAKISDISAATMTVELADTADRVALFQEMLMPFGLVEVARTGVIAMQKGSVHIG
jgi:acetolactate synthase-1/3 small subunit